MNTEIPPITFWHRLILSVLSLYCLWGGVWKLLFSAHNRFFLFFSNKDLFVLTAIMWVGGVLVAWALQAAARLTKGKSDVFLSPFFFIFLVQSIVQYFPTFRMDYIPWVSGTFYFLCIWVLGGGLTLCAFRYPVMRQLATRGWKILFILWPILILFPVTLCRAMPWSSAATNALLPYREVASSGSPIIVFLFDMMGYDEIFDEQGNVHPYLPNFQQMSAISTVFHDARSGGDETCTSIPGLLFQEEVGFLQIREDGVFWPRVHGSGEYYPATAFTNGLLARARDQNRRTQSIGYYFPWKQVMKDEWDAVFAMSFPAGVKGGFNRPPPTVLQTAGYYIRYYLDNVSKTPLSGFLKQTNLLPPAFMQNHRQL